MSERIPTSLGSSEAILVNCAALPVTVIVAVSRAGAVTVTEAEVMVTVVVTKAGVGRTISCGSPLIVRVYVVREFWARIVRGKRARAARWRPRRGKGILGGCF